jgi:ABC-type transport system involved in multi-copper enzyme maturation permease subunit
MSWLTNSLGILLVAMTNPSWLSTILSHVSWLIAIIAYPVFGFRAINGNMPLLLTVEANDKSSLTYWHCTHWSLMPGLLFLPRVTLISTTSSNGFFVSLNILFSLTVS